MDSKQASRGELVLYPTADGKAQFFLRADRAAKRQDIKMTDWRQYVDNFLLFNERELLKHAGKNSHEKMVQIVHERYATFDGQRRLADAKKADANDIKALEIVGKLGGKLVKESK